MRYIKAINENKRAVMVSTETLEIAAHVCDGAIKGTSLPRSERAVEWWSKERQREITAECGDYIVEMAPGVFEQFPRELFRLIFVDNDTTCF